MAASRVPIHHLLNADHLSTSYIMIPCTGVHLSVLSSMLPLYDTFFPLEAFCHVTTLSKQPLDCA